MTELVAVSVITAVSAYILNALGFGGTRLFLVFSSVVMLIFTLGRVGDVISRLVPLFTPLGDGILVAALKVLGIGYIGGFFSDFCEELGARGAASGLSLMLRLETLGVVLPYFTDILALAKELLS